MREHIKVAAQPINWINDDFKDLGADTSLETCLGQMREAGYDGSELGHRFPDDGGAIRATLRPFGLQLAAAWHSTYFASRSYQDEERSFDAHARKLRDAGADVVILAECTDAIHGDGTRTLSFPPAHQGARAQLSSDQWGRLVDGLERLAVRARDVFGLKTGYHEHMGTVVQDAGDVDALLAATSTLGLVLDTGHLTFAGADPVAVLEKHHARVTHVHLKNVRAPIAESARGFGGAPRFTFEQAVRAGVFTVPGDPEGCVDFERVFAVLDKHDYRGWFVVEAEQDPHKANPLAYAKMARSFLRAKAGV